ncbi:MAG: GNAT family N-acetyltransferase, partial [Gammaproteobacteria bacterium]|nr:GNAT family N-acetyltransferase [Gammaproteobacteria bacterium]
LFELFAATRNDLIAAIPNLDAAQKENFLRVQFQAQRDQYLAQFTSAQWDLIVSQGRIIGQILVAPIGDEIRLVDVSLLPEFRNRGIGGALLEDLLDRAASENRCVSLHVLPDNPAIHLYRRLGFVHAGVQGVHQRMEWRPAAADAVSADPAGLRQKVN